MKMDHDFLGVSWSNPKGSSSVGENFVVGTEGVVLAECLVGGVRPGGGVLVLAGSEVAGEVTDEGVGYVLLQRRWNGTSGSDRVGEKRGEGFGDWVDVSEDSRVKERATD